MQDIEEQHEASHPLQPEAQAYHVDFALHTLGWKAFQDLCAQVMEEELGCTLSVYREAQDDGQDALFLAKDDIGLATVGTVQCKFSSKREQRLRPSDITPELEHVQQLVANKMASIYYFVTSMGVDAYVARQIREQLFSLGVVQPHVVGKEWLLLKIRNSPRLRALVPRVYGLGDLSVITDERCAAQTLALLGNLRKSLSSYVPTGPHRRAVDILEQHKLVLLLGAPATGKSTLAAILATMAVDKNEVRVFKCDGPLELKQHWDPHDYKRLFWVDDAFGSNLLMTEYINAWVEFMPKFKTALEHGCHFILTSRTHIWSEAKTRIGSRNHPLMEDGTVIVDVGALTQGERVQILYNHIKNGNQLPSWKSRIKDHLAKLSNEPRLLPELARRLGDSRYTKHIVKLPDDLLRFISQPQQFLVQTFEELTPAQQAALVLVFLSKSRLPVHALPPIDTALAGKSYGVTTPEIAQALQQLVGSLIIRRQDGDQEYWAFWHPTFADAVILSKRPDLIDVYIRGARLDTLLGEVVCEGGASVRDAVKVPRASGDALIERLLESPDEEAANEKLFDFLNQRLPKELVRNVLERSPGFVGRRGAPSAWTRSGRQAHIRLRATAHSMGLLPEDVRFDTVFELEDGVLLSLDASFVQDDAILAMFQPSELMALTARLLAKLDAEISQKIDARRADADPDSDIDSHFEEIADFLDDIAYLVQSSSVFEEQHSALMLALQKAKGEVEAEKAPDEDKGSFFSNMPRAVQREQQGGRSIFSDVDE
jgi:energy-coupling factor transporter ATP-binding protein EcfA2